MIAQPFEKRYSCILNHFSEEHPVVTIASRFLCESTKALVVSLHQVVENAGEGIILRKPNSLYQFGRTSSLLKLKASRPDQEALVVNVELDGSLLLQLPDGTIFVVAKSDCTLHRRPVSGDVVTFTQDFATPRVAQDAAAFRSAEQGEDVTNPVWEDALTQDSVRCAPSNPFVHRIRTDVSWEDVVRNFSSGVRQFVHEPHQKMPDYNQQKPQVNWRADLGKNMRKRIEVIARSQGIDPLIAENWYTFSRDEFTKYTEIRTLVKYFGGSLTKALVELFPEVNLDITQFAATPVKIWSKAENRRKLYEQYALEKGGDHLDSNFWYSQNHKDFLDFRGMSTVARYYKSYAESIVHLFPELNLDLNKFKRPPTLSWKQEKERRDFFDNFAASQGFNPLVAENWYSVSKASLLQYQGYETIVRHHYKGNFAECLMHLYPDIGLQQSKFYAHKLSYWQSAENRKKALIDFAKLHSFNPLVAANWYPISSAELESVTEVESMLRFYGGKYIAALSDLFPEVHFDPLKFTHIPLGFWEDVKNRKNLFIEIARQRGFDPLIPSNWYPISYSSLEKIKGVASIVTNYYRGGLAKTLMHLFPDIGFEKSKFKFKEYWKEGF